MTPRFIFIITLLFGTLTSGYTQDKKLPQIQQSSIWMENFEADGKLDEWVEPLEAYNTDTHIAYSLANDEDYLYLAVRSDRLNKVFMGGVTLEVGNNKGKLSVTYPYNFTYNRLKYPSPGTDPNTPYKFSDLQEVEVYGIPGLTDMTIPLVNAYGITVGIGRDIEELEVDEESGKIFYIVELSIPLLYLDKTALNELDYRIKMRGVIPSANFEGVKRPQGFHRRSDGRVVPFSTAEIEDMYQKELDLYHPSELTGTYRLAAKPE